VPLEAIELRVPERLRQMLEVQIERLSPDEQRLLEGASVAGAVFATHVSAAAIDLTLDVVEDLCDELGRRQQIVRAAGVQAFPDGTVSQRYAFVHALYREVCYGRVASGRRAPLHRRMGEQSEALYAERPSSVAAELAYHFEAGDARSRICGWSRTPPDSGMRIGKPWPFCSTRSPW